ncbi:MAG TPA: hypothetical protein VK631_09275, partial [Solirubrobacteraceae bacterium]|nr:hypothetical protein [Solirubrobacteraceae bacterium]
MIGPDRPHQVQLRRAAHAGDLRSGCLGDLHGERPDPARRTDDQHVLAGLDAPAVAEGLQGGEGGDRNRGRLLEGQIRRHPRQPVRSRQGVLGEGGATRAEHRLPRSESRHLRTDRLDDAG